MYLLLKDHSDDCFLIAVVFSEKAEEIIKAQWPAHRSSQT